MRDVLLTLLVAGSIVAGLALAGIYAIQRSLIYFPQPDPPAPPGGPRFEGLEQVELQAQDGLTVQAWHWPAPDGAATVVVLHGNAGDRSDRLDLVLGLRGLGLGVLVLDYRGYGGSEGSPSEAGLYQDAEAAVDWLRARGAEDLVYLGESLGTGVAVELAVRRRPRALVLEAPFDGLAEVGRGHFPWLPVRWLLRDRFASASKIARIGAPLLIIHGDRDEVVPQPRGRALFEAAVAPKQLWSVPGAGHNDLRARTGAAYFERIGRFLGEAQTN